MDKIQKGSISAALIVVLCFFLPWIQVSCGTAKDSLSGVDLARETHSSLWLIPLAMLVVVFLNFVPAWKSKLDFGALATFILGIISAYLMNRERTRAEDHAVLVAVRETGWFWLGLAAAIGVAVTGAIRFLRRPKPL
jgi:hypothetical protein